MFSLLAISFAVSNTLRVLFYLPQFHKFINAKDSLESHSLFMWLSWVVANLTVAIYFCIQSGLDQKALLNFANSIMCCIGVSIIIYKRAKYRPIEFQDKTLFADQQKSKKHPMGAFILVKNSMQSSLLFFCQAGHQHCVVVVDCLDNFLMKFIKVF